MAKLHPSLVPLSREHHVALLLAFRLVHGLPPSRQADDSPQAQAQDTVRFFQTRLTTHFRAEEQADPSSFNAQLKAFGRLLERHVRSEERELFPMCEANLADDDADRLKVAIADFVGEGRP